MYCRNCGEAMNENQAICVSCGVQATDGSSYCPNCGNEVTPGADVCLNCGVSLVKAPTKAAAGNLGGQDKITMALICFFFGGLGIHNFMMGESKKGVTKILLSLCFGIGAILALIDFIKILTDSYEVDPEKAF